jgi:RimJ/RimL family protein N-acetyltransferase
MEITQRTACLEDVELLLSWRNDETTRRFSGQSQTISFEEHLRWFTARLERIDIEPFFLFSANQKPIGTSRLDILVGSEKKFEISILVDPKQSGIVLGTQILEMTCAAAVSSNHDFSILAKVHKENLISQKLFTRAGFTSKLTENEFLRFEKVF